MAFTYYNEEFKRIFRVIGYYRKFIPDYGQVSYLLTQLTKKDSFIWTPETIAAFHKPKALMLSPRVLTLLDFSKTFIIKSDAFGKALELFYNKRACQLLLQVRH